MGKLAQRLLTFFVVVPILIILFFWDLWNHFPLILVTILVSALGAFETGVILTGKGFPVNRYLAPVLGISFPLLGYLEVVGLVTPLLTMIGVAILISLVFMRQIFTNKDLEIQTILHKVTGNLFVLIYPGLFLYFFVKFAHFPWASQAYFIFCFLTFGNDSFAWLFGSIFGKNSPKPIVVSPNKSVIGFVGGFLATIAVTTASYWVFPEVMGFNILHNIILGVILGFVTIIGDLFESAIKRSAGTKDSGAIIPGRGGILDSIDSLMFSAPIFYLFLELIHTSRGLF